MTAAADAIYLKEWRIYAGLIQAELGNRMGITGTQISRIENGKRDWDGRFLRKFKAVINKALDDHPQGAKPSHIRIGHIADAVCVKPDPETWLSPATEQLWRELIVAIANDARAALTRS